MRDNLSLVYNGLLSVAFLCCIVNIILLVKIRFGNKLVTHLTSRPYIVSLVLFSVMIVEYTVLCLIKDVFYDIDQVTFMKQLYDPLSTVSKIDGGFIIVKISTVLVFIFVRAHEQETLLAFLYF